MFDSRDENGVTDSLRDALSTICLGDVMSVWQEQRQICVGSHTDFAKHLLNVHKAYCLDYCQAESQEKAALILICGNENSKEPSNSQLLHPDDDASKTEDFKEDVEETSQDSFPDEVDVPSVDSPEQADVKPFSTADHGKSCSDIGGLELQMRSHVEKRLEVTDEINRISEKTYTCMICDLIFNKRRKLQAHISKHSSTFANETSNVFSNLSPVSMECEVDNTFGNKVSSSLYDIPDNLNVTETVEKQCFDRETHPIGKCNAKSSNVMETIGKADLATSDTKAVRDRLKRRTTAIDINSLKINNVGKLKQKRLNQTSMLSIHSELNLEENKLSEEPTLKSFCTSVGCDKLNKDMSAVNPHICFECGDEFESITDLNNHLREHIRGNFNSSSVLSDGLDLMHQEGEKSHTCSECGIVFKRLDALNYHMQKHTGNVCSVCGKDVCICNDIMPHVCSECGKRFRLKHGLKVHMLSHTGEKPHICTECGRGFSLSGSLKTHMTTHTGERAHVCHQCGASFAFKGNLTKHILTHNQHKPYVCEECGRGFIRANDLRRHMQDHAGEMPHMCQICGERFNRIDKLKAHIVHHTGVMPYKCPECGKGFSTTKYIKRHMIIHTGMKPYVCQVCGKACNQSYNLKMHMKVHQK